MTTLLLFLPFFLSLPEKLPLQQLFVSLFHLLKNRVFLVISLKLFFLRYCSANPPFFQIFVIYNTCPVQKQKIMEFLCVETKLQQLICYKVTSKNKIHPTYPAISRQKVDETVRNLECRKVERLNIWKQNDINNTSCTQRKQKLMTVLWK